MQGGREGDLVRRGNAGAHGSETVQALAEVELLVGGLDLPGRHVVDDGVAKDIVRRVCGLHVFGALPDDDCQLILVVQPICKIGVALNEALRRHGLADPLGKVHGDGPLLGESAVIVGRLGQVVPVVHAQADDILPGPGNGGQQGHGGQGQGVLCRFRGGKQLLPGGFNEGIHVSKGQGTNHGAVHAQHAYGFLAVLEIGNEFHGGSPLNQNQTADRKPCPPWVF